MAARRSEVGRDAVGRRLPPTTLVDARRRRRIPGRVVAACVAQAEADLLVIGTRGAGGLSRILLGSVAETLLRTLEIDVLAVPALVAYAS